MIYLVTRQQDLIESASYKIISVKDSLDLLMSKGNLGVDSETFRMDPHTGYILSLQIGDGQDQVVIDTTNIDLQAYKPLLESKDREFLFWNARFDLKFLYKHGIVPHNVYDGFLAEKLLWLGYPAGMHKMDLKSAAYDYLGVSLDKSIRGNIISRGLCEDVIVYGARDVQYLQAIKDKQAEKLEAQGLTTAIAVENAFVPVLAYFEYCGVKVDVQGWKDKAARDKERLAQLKEKIDSWVVEYGDPRFIKQDLQGELFLGFKDKECAINWSSSSQVIPLFESLGLNLSSVDTKGWRIKKSIEDVIIEPQKDKSPLIPMYLEYKKAEKAVSTYGEDFLRILNPKTLRIHTNFNQIQDTGRLSSGGKDKENGIEYVNMQNIPSDPQTRALFIPEEGNLWISIDYKGQENVILADISEDPAMIEEILHGSGDIHSLVAKMTYPQIIGDTPVSEIKEKFPKIRKDVKGSVEFPINYGGDWRTIKSRAHKSESEAKELYANYMKGFSGIKAYQDFRRREVMQKGYILHNPKTGHKAYIYDFDRIMKAKKRLDDLNEQGEGYYKYRTDFDSLMREWPANTSAGGVRESITQKILEDFIAGTIPEGTISNAVPYKIRSVDGPTVKYFYPSRSLVLTLAHRYVKDRIGASERQSINYPVQATGALTFKFACISFFNYLRKNDLLFKVLMIVPVHDEINVEAPKEIAEEVASKLKECMVDAGTFFLNHVPLDADVSIGDHWIH